MDTKIKEVNSNHKAYSSGSLVTILSTETLAEHLTLCKDWNLSIDLKLPNRSSTEWRNIFSLYQKNGQLDQRVLAVTIRRGQSYVWLMVEYDAYTNQNYKQIHTKKVNAGNWINLKISQMNGLHEIKIDYKLVYTQTNFTLKVWTNVYLVTGNNYGKQNFSTTVYYRNFKIETCKTTGSNTDELKNNIAF